MNQSNYAQRLVNEVGESLYLLNSLTKQQQALLNDALIDNLNESTTLIQAIVRHYHNYQESH